ncbi:uncharacterized protein LOC129733207 [Wyeomyia smithii]|uniref:uncharacterized protein LOC129733207 n=1 Tax=Wyeomyia smithii TaxID=174621 RepID=UPI002467B804|nr:uncharacterized protein LOC129733207 [Wyeomyia smithii]
MMSSALESILLSTKYYAPESWVPGKSTEIARQINGFVRDSNEAAMLIAYMICDSNGFRVTIESGGAGTFHAPYYGRGYIKLCWRSNYEEASRDLCDPRILHNPDVINSSVELCTRVSIWYWEKKIRPVLARSARKTFFDVTKIFNPGADKGSTYVAERYSVYCQAARVLGVTNLIPCA